MSKFTDAVRKFFGLEVAKAHEPYQQRSISPEQAAADARLIEEFRQVAAMSEDTGEGTVEIDGRPITEPGVLEEACKSGIWKTTE